jgi:hypothetical protein
MFDSPFLGKNSSVNYPNFFSESMAYFVALMFSLFKKHVTAAKMD